MKGRIIHYQYVLITDGSGRLRDRSEFKQEVFNVIGENSIRIVIDDLHFTSMYKRRDNYGTSLGVPGISLSAGDSLWGNRISYMLYTETPKRASTIKREIEAAINAKFGYFMQWVDLSILDKKGGAS